MLWTWCLNYNSDQLQLKTVKGKVTDSSCFYHAIHQMCWVFSSHYDKGHSHLKQHHCACTDTCTHACTHTCIHTYTKTPTQLHTPIPICTHMNVHTHAHALTHTHACSYTHVHMYTHTRERKIDLFIFYFRSGRKRGQVQCYLGSGARAKLSLFRPWRCCCRIQDLKMRLR